MSADGAPTQTRLKPLTDAAARGAFVDGGWLAPSGEETFSVVEPATAGLARVAACGPAQVDAAVTSAERRFADDWRWRSPRERGALMREVAARIRSEHVDETAEARGAQIDGPPRRPAIRRLLQPRRLRLLHGLADTLHGEILDQGPIEARIVYEPYGVVAAILPFNWPPIHFTKKCAPALAAGNTVVIKPGEQARSPF